MSHHDDAHSQEPIAHDPRAEDLPQEPEPDAETLRRRRFIQAGIGVSVVLTVGGLSALSVTGGLRPIARATPDREPPTNGDELVLADDQAHIVHPRDLPLGGGLTMAYARQPSTQVVKSGTVDNLVLLARFDERELAEAARRYAAAGVVAYSAICTHLGCTVSEWDADQGWLHCPCHHARFDPRDGARVTAGPAPRPLPALPLRADGDAITVAGGFTSPVGVL